MDPLLSFDEADVTAPITGAERQRNYRRRDPKRAQGVRRKYRHDNSKWETDASYLSRRFVAWDGEGITTPDGVHRYVMLAVKTDADSDYLADVHGLATTRIFEFVLNFGQDTKDAIHVIYGGGYDFNMWFRDLPEEVVDKLYHNDFVRWNGYRMAWRPGKSFYISRVGPNGKKIGAGVTLYDVVSFFQCPFVKACDDYLGGEFYQRQMIVDNKALRSSFTEADIPQVRVYNDAELTNLLRLMYELRLRLNKCGLRPRRWDGPGAVAAALLLREDVKAKKAECPPDVARAARFAYAGGRFELLKFGDYDGKVWEYDVNSAYPAALRNVPDLTRGQWRHAVGDPGPQSFALYHVRYRGNDPAIPGAFFRRDANGTICYPMAVAGWYWSPEVAVGRDYCARGHGDMEVIEAWVFEEDTSAQRPFHFIDGLYNKRRALKKARDGAHVGIKLALNSLYGKLAQQVGARIDDEGVWRLPPFHQLEWAGYTTSWCRAAVLGACLDDLDAVVAFETDAVFVTRPLPVVDGTGLGDFEAVEFDRLAYVQSGMYFGWSEGKAVNKTRGVDRCSCDGPHDSSKCGALTLDMVREAYRNPVAEERKVKATLSRFVGAGIALAQSWSRWRTWEKMEKRLSMQPSGKRVHMGCECMTVEYGANGKPVNGGLRPGWHRTECPMMGMQDSCEFPIMWINPDPNMTELAEMREREVSYE